MRTTTSRLLFFALVGVALLPACGDRDTTPRSTSGSTNLVLPTELTAYAPGVSSFCNLSIDCCACTGLTHGSSFEVLDGVGYQAGSPTQKQVVPTVGLEPIVLEIDRYADPQSASSRPLVYVGGCEPAGSVGAVWMYEEGTTTPIDPTRAGRIVMPTGEFPMSLRLRADGTLLVATLDTDRDLRVHMAVDSDADGVPDQLSLFADTSTLADRYDDVVARLTEGPFDVVALGSPHEVAVFQANRYLFRFVDGNQDGTAEAALFAPRHDPVLSTFRAGTVPGSSRVWADAGALSDRTVELWTVDAGGTPLLQLATATTGAGGGVIFDLPQPLVAGDRVAVRVTPLDAWGEATEVEAATAPSAMPISTTEIEEGETIDVYVPEAASGVVTATWTFYDNSTWPLQDVSKPLTVSDLGGSVFRLTLPSVTEDVRLQNQVIVIEIPELSESSRVGVRVTKP